MRTISTSDPRYNWINDYQNIVEFAEVLVKEYDADTEMLLDYLHKPWHWTDEREEWMSRQTVPRERAVIDPADYA